MEKFRELGLIEPILRVIKEEGFEKPTEIQEKSIPLVISGRDVIACSATGSGKTLAFAATIIKNSEHGTGIQALVLTPTRELAEQVSTHLEIFSRYKPLSIVSIYGGLSINPQIGRLARADVVVGTPGRILDHLERRTIDLSRLKILVLDEADRMLDMGFIDDVKRIIRACPQKRQTLLFSATITEDLAFIIDRSLKSPVSVSAESYVDPKKLKQIYYDVPDGLKFSLLFHLLKHEKSGLVMVFCNTRRNTDFVAKNLSYLGIDAMATHGGFSQEKRNMVIDRFHSKNAHVLVCTDVAARGLDIKGVSHIYNYDIPKDSKDYIHRIGRTARAGKEGKVVNILAHRDYENFSRVSRDDNLKITREEMPMVERVSIRLPEREGGFRQRDNQFGRSSGRGGSSYGRGRFGGRDRGYGRSDGRFSTGRRFGREGGSYKSRNESSHRRDGESRTDGRGYGRENRGRFNSRSGRFGGRDSRGSSRSYGRR